MRRNLVGIQTYSEDGRSSLQKLYTKYDELIGYGFEKETVYTVFAKTLKGDVEMPVYCYKSLKKGPSIWLLAGVHGEEPAGPNAIALNISYLGQLGREIPLVVFPLLNPKGYSLNYRYPNEIRDFHKGHSVSDCEHYLLDIEDPTKPRALFPGSEIAAKVTKFVLDTIYDYPPLLTEDHHEDETLERGYIYSQAFRGSDDPAAQKAVDILRNSGIPIQEQGTTRFGEKILDGIVVGEDGRPVKDGSIDELLGGASKIIVDGKIIEKPVAKTSLVIETPTINVPLEKRIKAHSNVIKGLKTLWQLANTLKP